MMKWLNPANWIKAAVAAKIDAEIDEKLAKEFLNEKGRELLNYLITLSESKMDDCKVRAVAADLTYCGNSLLEIGNAINPDGEEGRKLSENETNALNARLQVLFGDVVTDDDLAAWREKAKAFVHEKLGV